MWGFTGVPESIPHRAEVADVCGLTGLSPGGARSTAGAPGDDDPCPVN